MAVTWRGFAISIACWLAMAGCAHQRRPSVVPDVATLATDFCEAAPVLPVSAILDLAQELARTELELSNGDVVVMATIRRAPGLRPHDSPPRMVFDPGGVDVCAAFSSRSTEPRVVPCSDMGEVDGSVGVDLAVDCDHPRLTAIFGYPQPAELDSGADLIGATFDVWIDLDGDDLSQVASGCVPRGTERLSRAGFSTRGIVHTSCRPFQQHGMKLEPSGRKSGHVTVPERTIGLFGQCVTHEDCPAPFQCIEYATFSGERRSCGMLCKPEEAGGDNAGCLPGWQCREGGGHAPSVCSRGY